ncbi:tryptophan--trna ligase mitochondrial [Holotrichia oblita]|nr:tryptophan--trna ligase mitochondrial [Holotrichia oblita]
MENQTEIKERKKIIFSGIQPSGAMTIGNYAGALRNWVKLIEEYDCFYCVVDMHAITVAQEPAILRKNTFEAVALLIACGVDPEKCALYIQSHVPAHAELTWVLNCNTMFGEARRMTQFKEKSSRHPENVNVGLFDYPVLQAADILLYQTNLVPIGADQKQHLELSRDLAIRFNSRYGETFAVPDAYIPLKESGGRIMSLAEPEKKMSKSDANENAYILLTDSPEVIVRKFKRAVTDSEARIAFHKTKPGVSNLLSIYSVFAKVSISEAEKQMQGLGYGDFKLRVADAVIAALKPIQDKYSRLVGDKEYINKVLDEGAEKARYAARKTLSKVYRKIGFYSTKN